jgi:hypothetical protein
LIFKELEPELPVLFTHVPKTGGSTITGAMAALFGRDNIAGISSATPERRHTFLQGCHSEGKKYVYGHFRYPDAAQVYDRANLIASVRHPVDRILSFYFMLLRAQSDFAIDCAKDVKGEGFRKFHDRLVRRRRQDNLMCRYFCDEPDHEAAIQVLRDRYCLVWDSDSAFAAWKVLHRELTGKEAAARKPSRRNGAPVGKGAEDFSSGARPRNYATFLPPENQQLLLDTNSEDVRLFEWFEKQAASANAAEPEMAPGGTHGEN